MIFRTRPRFHGFGVVNATAETAAGTSADTSLYVQNTACNGLTWETWCDCQFPLGTDPTNNTKCKTKPWSCCPVGICPPWAEPSTAVGSSCRGLPRQANATGVYNAAYDVQSVLSVVSLADKLLIVPQQTTAIQTQDATAATQTAIDQQTALAQQNAATQRATLIKLGEWGGIALAGIISVLVIREVLTPKRAVAASAPRPA